MFKEILLPIDLEHLDASSSELAAALDHCRDDAVRLHLLAVLPGFGMSIISQYFPSDYEKQAQEDALKHLQDFIKEKVPEGIKTQAIIASGTVYEEILETAKNIGCDLIVMSAGHQTMEDYLLGTNASRVVRHANCSVLVVRD